MVFLAERLFPSCPPNYSNCDEKVTSFRDRTSESFELELNELQRIPFTSTNATLTHASLCPFDIAPELLAIATTTSLCILDAQQNFECLSTQALGSPLTAWSWSPETYSSSNGDKNVMIAVAGQDTRVLLYHSRLGLLEVPGLNPIKSTVTDMAFDRTRGTFLALITDDKLLRVFAFDVSQPSIIDKNGDVQIPDCVISWPLSSRGVSVSFHTFLSDHLLLAEESGSIRFLNLQTKEWIFSVHEPAIVHSPFGLRSADWNPTDPNVFGAVIGDQWFVWNLAESPIHVPHHTGDAHSQGGHLFKWSRTQARTFALTGLPSGRQSAQSKSIKVFESLLKRVPMSLECPVPLKGMSFHSVRDQLIVFGAHQLFTCEL